jgi:hypothetical protein
VRRRSPIGNKFHSRVPVIFTVGNFEIEGIYGLRLVVFILVSPNVSHVRSFPPKGKSKPNKWLNWSSGIRSLPMELKGHSSSAEELHLLLCSTA